MLRCLLMLTVLIAVTRLSLQDGGQPPVEGKDDAVEGALDVEEDLGEEKDGDWKELEDMPPFHGYVDLYVPPYTRSERLKNRAKFTEWLDRANVSLTHVRFSQPERKLSPEEAENLERAERERLEEEKEHPRHSWTEEDNDVENAFQHRRVLTTTPPTPSVQTMDGALFYELYRAGRSSVFDLRAMLYSDISSRWSLNALKAIQHRWEDMHHRHRVFLALYIIHQVKLRGGSFWTPFLNTFPRKFFHPVAWDDAVVAELQASPLKGSIASYRQQLRDDYHILIELFTHPNQGFTMQLWNWAMVTASTSIWEIELEDAGVRIFGIIPLTHMMRKHFNPDTEILVTYHHEEDEYVLHTSIPYEKGSEVFDVNRLCDNIHCTVLKYGVYPDDEQLNGPPPSTYEHVNYLPWTILLPRKNAEDGTVYELLYLDTLRSFSDAASFAPAVLERKIEMLLEHDLMDVRLEDGPNGSTSALIAFRVAMMTESELNSATLVEGALRGERVSKQNEQRMAKAVATLVLATLSYYDTTLEHDEQLLPTIDEDNVPLRMAVRTRMMEKRIYWSLIGRLEAMEPLAVTMAMHRLFPSMAQQNRAEENHLLEGIERDDGELPVLDDIA